jgi:hypothetical protein
VNFTTKWCEAPLNAKRERTGRDQWPARSVASLLPNIPTAKPGPLCITGESIRLPIDPVEFSSALWAKLFTERPAELGRSEAVFAKLPLVEAHRILDTAAARYTVATLRPAK